MLRRQIRSLVVLVALVFCWGCAGGNIAYQQGRKAELRKDWDTALVDYQKALQYQPGNAAIQLHERLVRTQASLAHLKRGRELLKLNRLEEASGEFQKAASIDPSNEAAAQGLARVLAVQAEAKKARESKLKQALKASEAEAAPGPVKLNPFPQGPITRVHLGPIDSRKAFETVAKLAGMNVAFTADFAPKQVSLDLSDIKIEDVLNVLCMQTKSFYRPLTPNTFLVVPDTPTNHRDYDQEVVRTIYLMNPLTAQNRTAITTAIKQVLGVQRIIDNPDANAIIIRDTPAKVQAAEQLIRDLDRGKAEILIDVAVVEADRDRVQDLGLTPQPVSVSGANTTGLVGAIGFNPTTSATTTGGTSIPFLPLNRLGKISTSDFSVVLPGATASALLGDSHTHILQNPQVRVTDGETAKLRIGQRIPYATGSFLPSFGGSVSGSGGFGLLASTQFQFQDVGVILDLTPHLLSNGEVALHAAIEISSLGAPINVGGFSEPSFGQRRIEHDIRLKEGEVNLLGGLIQSQDSTSKSGLPGLSQIPLLRYLFSEEHHERIDTEVLVMLTPRVIRLPESGSAGANVAVGGGPSAPLPQIPEAAPGVPVGTPEEPSPPPGEQRP